MGMLILVYGEVRKREREGEREREREGGRGGLIYMDIWIIHRDWFDDCNGFGA